MIKNELEKTDKYVQELEALQNYAQVKAERDSLASEAAHLKEEVEQLTARVETEASMRKKLSSQLKKNESETEELRSKLGKAEKERSSLKDFKVKLPTGSGLTLEQMKEQFLQAQAQEIEAKTKERLEVLEKERRRQMPNLIKKEFTRVLNIGNWPPEIEKVVSSHASRLADELLRDKEKWPDYFKNYYHQQVTEAVAKELDQEFTNRVEAEARNRLEEMKTGEWERYRVAKARELAVDLRAMGSQLQGTWYFTCDRCGQRLPIEIGPSEIAQLLAERTVDVTCSACSDMAPPPFFLNTIPHKVLAFTLEDLLQWYFGEPPSE